MQLFRQGRTRGDNDPIRNSSYLESSEFGARRRTPGAVQGHPAEMLLHTDRRD